MMPIHNLKARSLTDYNKDLGLGIKVGAKYRAHIRAGLTTYLLIALGYRGPHPAFAKTNRNIFWFHLWLGQARTGTKAQLCLQTRVTRYPKQVSWCCYPLGVPGWAPQWLISLGFNLGLLAFSPSRAFFLLQLWLWFPKSPSTRWEPTILWFLFQTWPKL